MSNKYFPCCLVGDYIALYQTQREALKTKFQEKDDFIQRLMAEKAAMQANVTQLQVLVRKVLAQQGHTSSLQPAQQGGHPSSPQGLHNKAYLPSTPRTPSSPQVSDAPSSSSHHLSTPYSSHYEPNVAESASVPFHLRPQHSTDAVDDNTSDADDADLESDLVGVEVEHDSTSFEATDNSHLSGDESRVNTTAAEKIMELLDQLEATSDNSGHCHVMVQCRMCTGELIVV